MDHEEKSLEEELHGFLQPEHLRRTTHGIANYVLTFLKWALIASLIGCISGGIGALFHHSIATAAAAFGKFDWLLYILPAVGVIIAGIYHFCRLNEYTGTNLILTAIRGEEDIPWTLAPLIFISTVLTHLCGGSAGREGAALQLGGTIGIKIGRLFRVREKEISLAILCGMSGVFSALFGTPLTATFFAMEVISVGIYYHSSFLPCLLSALIAYEISVAFGMEPVSFTLKFIPDITILSVIRIILLAALCGAVSILFCEVMHSGTHLLKKRIPNDYLRAAVGGVAIILLTFLCRSREYNGAGMSVIIDAINGDCRREAFLLKMLFTSVTIGAGFKGGEIVPCFFVGATFGCTAGKLLGIDPGFAAAIGLIAVFCGSVNCPIASIFMSYEMFGGAGLIFFAVACGVSYILSGYFGLYSSQKIVYSKLRAEYINKNTL